MMPTPPLAYHDPGFLDSEEGRPIRIVSEYLAPLRAFSAAGVTATVVFFGSARVRAGGPLGRYLEEAMELAPLVAEMRPSLPRARNIGLPRRWARVTVGRPPRAARHRG